MSETDFASSGGSEPPPVQITVDDIEDFARGCALLGTGGGGDVQVAIAEAIAVLERSGPVDLVPLSAIPDDEIVLPLSGVGAPTVSQEMPFGLQEPILIRDEVERLTGRRVAAIAPSEIGGGNGVAPAAWASRLGLPLVDADAMGRAFPEVDMVTPNVVGIPLEYFVMADVLGNVSVVRPVNGRWSERLARSLCVAAGSSTLMADYVLPAQQLRGALIEGTVSQALKMGKILSGSTDPLTALMEYLNGTVLVTGKITDVERVTGGGFARGAVFIEGTGEDRDRSVRIEIQNEYLLALEDGRRIASVPDLIVIVDSQTAEAISTENLRYGQRVSAVAWPCNPLWRTPRGLEIAGPDAFGFHEVEYVPVEELGRNHGN